MLNSQTVNPVAAKIVVVTADQNFEDCVRAVFGAGRQVELDVFSERLSDRDIDFRSAAVLIVDLDNSDELELQALERIVARVGHRAAVIAITQCFDGSVARRLMQMQVADLLIKPVQGSELLRACVRVAEGRAYAEATEAQIFTFLPAVGGAGVTTLAIQTALLLLNSVKGRKTATCLVDLDFQHGACADYLDLEPRLNLGEIEPRPERLDRQLLEVMLSYHASGLALIAAPNRPAEMRSFDPLVVTRLLDLVSSHFDFVVFDMPRTWFSWTDDVLLGSNQVFIVSETTVPSLRQARQLVGAVRERLGEQQAPQVIVNRFEQKLFSAGLRRADIERAIGDSLAALVPNDYGLVREAIDRGVPLDEIKPGNKITAQLKKFIVPQPEKAVTAAGATPTGDLDLRKAAQSAPWKQRALRQG
jgi:pilus assembly protein CpaE